MIRERLAQRRQRAAFLDQVDQGDEAGKIRSSMRFDRRPGIAARGLRPNSFSPRVCSSYLMWTVSVGWET